MHVIELTSEEDSIKEESSENDNQSNGKAKIQRANLNPRFSIS